MASLDFDELIDAAEQQGWRKKLTTSGHVQLYSPNGKDIATCGGTPSDFRAVLNFRAELKRKGLKLEDEPASTRPYKSRAPLCDAALAVFRAFPDSTFDTDALLVRVRDSHPEARKNDLYGVTERLVKDGKITRISVGRFRLSSLHKEQQERQETPVNGNNGQAVSMGAVVAAPTRAGISDDMAALNAAADKVVEGITQIQAILGRAQGVLSQIEALRQLLIPIKQ